MVLELGRTDQAAQIFHFSRRKPAGREVAVISLWINVHFVLINKKSNVDNKHLGNC